MDPGPAGGLNKGDLVVGIVRRPDPVPCPNCAVGEWDMCRNGQYTERGIKQIDGYSTAIMLMGEVVTTFGPIAALCIFLGFRQL
jgi:hypothetical protein